MEDQKVSVTVQYVGKDDYHEDFPPNTIVQPIKLHAMHKFGLEAAAQDKYVLQRDGVDVSDRARLGDLGQDDITFVLSLASEVVKG